MKSKAKMAGVRLEEIELMEAWSEENDEVRARFHFPLTAASGCTSCSVIYYVIEPGHRTPMHIHSVAMGLALRSVDGLPGLPAESDPRALHEHG
jgi:hypothetical protein